MIFSKKMKVVIVQRDDKMTINPEILSMKNNILRMIITYKLKILSNPKGKVVNMYKNQETLEMTCKISERKLTSSKISRIF